MKYQNIVILLSAASFATAVSDDNVRRYNQDASSHQTQVTILALVNVLAEEMQINVVIIVEMTQIMVPLLLQSLLVKSHLQLLLAMSLLSIILFLQVPCILKKRKSQLRCNPKGSLSRLKKLSSKKAAYQKQTRTHFPVNESSTLISLNPPHTISSVIALPPAVETFEAAVLRRDPLWAVIPSAFFAILLSII